MRALLEKYFVGPIDDAKIDRLQQMLAKLAASVPHLSGEESSFRENGRLYFGDLWVEELARDAFDPDADMLAVWVAVSHGLFEARPYCPPAFVGTWQTDGARWELAADGTFATDFEKLAEYTHWCVHRQAHDALNRGDVLWTIEEDERRTLMIDEVSADAITLTLIGETTNTLVRWKRV